MASFRAEWWTLKNCEELINCFSVSWAIPKSGLEWSKTLLRMVVVKELDIIKQWAVDFKKKNINSCSKSYGRIKKSRSTAIWTRNQEEIKIMASKIFWSIVSRLPAESLLVYFLGLLWQNREVQHIAGCLHQLRPHSWVLPELWP